MAEMPTSATVRFHLSNGHDLEVPRSVVPAFERACAATRAYIAGGGTIRCGADDDGINDGYSNALWQLSVAWSEVTRAFPTGIRLERSLAHHIAQPEPPVPITGSP